ncbi:efflux transporter outer membrane subunit [Sphingomonas sp.]|jgi:NodT family efflux transporter outer membrane factor (OMF) lipoprotein|uniref:efflux transporter outer membrane subunit n=1 Tax=Sphingomonas sp. TaxID=28214 RepID=UPI002E3495D8|nr:efflux transporter outer membrane subunit [Sphingomonas sp.]HEX4693403.1 efflux transporter outer membrane subunit [Sphingomonas sp.]
MLKKPILLVSMIAVTACTVGSNYTKPDLAVPATFAGPQGAPPPGQAIDPARWWEAFGDSVLTGLIDRALKDNPDMATAASRVRQARLGEIQARAQYKPTVDATGNVTDVRFSKNAGFSSLARAFSGGGGSGGGTAGGVALPGDNITTYAVGFDASWELDIFGGGRRGVEAALARTEAAEWNRRDAAVTLAAEVADAYFALRLDQEQVAVLNSEIERQARALQIAGNIARVGLVPSIDVTRQSGNITATRARLEPLKADLEVRKHALGVLLGQNPEQLLGELSQPLPPLGATPPIPAGLPSDLLRRRPDIRAAERNLAASTADIGVATADLYPKFSLTGIAQLISTSLATLFSGDSLQLTGTGAATFPLLDWGRRKATVGVRKEQREQAYQQYRATVLQGLRDVEDSLVRIDAERRRNALLRQALADADRTVTADQARYRAGLVAQDAVINTQVEVLRARENVAASDAQLRQDTVVLFKAIGGGWSDASTAG